MNPYLRVIHPAQDNGDVAYTVPPGAILVDIYRILNAYDVRCHAVGHAIKKLLAAGDRGDKSYEQDLQEAIDSIREGIKMHKDMVKV